jgi:Mg2+ and Co2+ transporter CorA
LKKINFFQEEIGIIQSILSDQDQVLSDFDELLSPETFENPSPLRYERYEGEHTLIERVRGDLKDRMNFCTELADRSRRLARQNVELVEASADQSGRSIVIFTVVTIIFLPPTFIAGFFGMNVSGISGTVGLFWKIAGGTTAAVVVFTIACLIWGETVILWIASLPWKVMRSWKRLAARLNQRRFRAKD